MLGLLASDASQAATLQVRGNPGAQLYIDGELRGTLPLSEPLVLAPGVYELRVSLPGYISHSETIRLVDQSTALDLGIDLQPLSRWKATTFSVILAGLGQIYQGRKAIGWTFMALEVGAVLTAVWAENQFKQYRDDYDVAYRKYQQAIAPSEIARLRSESETAYEDMESAEQVRNIALYSAVGIVVVSAVEAWIAHDRMYVGSDLPEMGTRPMLEGSSIAVGWRTRF
jgi:hypothetical protein